MRVSPWIHRGILCCALIPVLAAFSPSPHIALERTPGRQVEPERPGPLAVGPDGNLYIADDQRDQILEMQPDGRFAVIAGTGKVGFSGDGGRAIDAKLNDPGGMIFGPGGTLYFADTGNDRIRAIRPDGTIYTVAGGGVNGGQRRMVNGSRAIGADLSGPTDVAIGQHGELYIADTGANQILRWNQGRLFDVVGSSRDLFQGVHGEGGAADRASADGVDGLAVNREGALYIAGEATKALLIVLPTGRLVRAGGMTAFYPRGEAGLAVDPSGQIVAMNGESIGIVRSDGIHVIVNFGYRHLPDGIGLFEPNGLAVGANGTIYADSFAGNGVTTKSAIVAIGRRGSVRILWHA